jgi:hypothetical protein
VQKLVNEILKYNEEEFDRDLGCAVLDSRFRPRLTHGGDRARRGPSGWLPARTSSTIVASHIARTQ